METTGEKPQPPSEQKSVQTVQTDSQEPAATRPVRSRAATWLATVALVLALGALVISVALGYVYYTKRTLFRTDVVGSIKQLRASTQRLDSGRTALEQTLATLQQQLTRATEVQGTLRASVEKLLNDLGRDRGDWRMAEAEQLLLIANYRLQLARDVDTAVAALRAADRQLQALADPQLLPVRKLIADELTQLQSLKRPDVPGMTLQLQSLAGTVSQLPLQIDRRYHTSPVSTAASGAGSATDGYRVMLHEMWHDLLSLVRIRTTTEPVQALLTPEQSYFLRQNLQLMLYGAQLALLEDDAPTYTHSLATARTWIEQYFDANAPAVTHAQQELQDLQEQNISFELPDISPSLKALRALMDKHQSRATTQ
jgi:uroporphyrin-3 C-methyltransferase